DGIRDFHVTGVQTCALPISSQDWTVFFESVSIVEQILRRDPADVYAAMDAATRNRYRRGIETLKRTSGDGEARVAQYAIGLAARSEERRVGKGGRAAHAREW